MSVFFCFFERAGRAGIYLGVCRQLRVGGGCARVPPSTHSTTRLPLERALHGRLGARAARRLVHHEGEARGAGDDNEVGRLDVIIFVGKQVAAFLWGLVLWVCEGAGAAGATLHT